MTNTATKLTRGKYARSQDTRAKILDAALEQATLSGFQNSSVAKIAARAQVAIGVLNYHFGSKQELLRELMAELVGDFLSQLTLGNDGDDWFSYEEQVVTTFLRFLRANPSYIQLTEEVRQFDSDLYNKGTAAHIELTIQRLQQGIRRGELRPMPSDELRSQAYAILGSYMFLDRYLSSPDYPGDATVAKNFIEGLRRSIGSIRPTTSTDTETPSSPKTSGQQP